MSDILIKNARIVDGTGSPWFAGSIIVSGDKIEEIIPGQLTGERNNKQLNEKKFDRVIEADSRVLAPGFIDIHTHSDLKLLTDGRAASKISQGVTTEVIGNCGYSPAPVTEAGREMLEEELADYNLELSWESYPEFLDQLEKCDLAVNVVPLIGQGALRKAVAGYEDRPLTAEELNRAGELTAAALEAGARGLSTGLIYPPSSYSSTEELIELSRIVADHGGIYTSHLREEGCGLISAVGEAVRIGREAGLPVHISHHKVSDRECWGLVAGSLRILETTRERGQDITCDVYPYTATSTGLPALLPDWAHEGGRPKLLERIKNQPDRNRLLDSLEEVGENRGWHSIIVSSLPGDRYTHLEGSRISEIAESWNISGSEAVLKILQDQELRAGMIGFAMCEQDLATVLTSRLSLIGSDGSALAAEGILAQGKPHPRNFGTFPRVLGRYVRERGVLKLEEAVHKMTGKTATRLGLFDRGLIRPGLAADLVLFDPDEVQDKATFTEPHQYPDGIHEVLVAGEPVINEGEQREVFPGRLLRQE